ARKIESDGNYSFYNPVIIPYSTNGGQQMYYAGVFSNAYLPSPPVQAYNYNVQVHMLDVGDRRTFLPVPVYELGSVDGPSFNLGTKAALRMSMFGEMPVPFFAYDREATGAIPAYLTGASCRPDHVMKVGVQPSLPRLFDPDFYMLPANLTSPPADSIPLYEYSLSFYRPYHVYAVDGQVVAPAFNKNPTPVGRVFKNPMAKVWFPATSYLPDLVADGGPDVCAAEGA